MGNIGSQTGHIQQRQLEEEQLKSWAHSFPRTQPRILHHQHKVLPERDINQKLRPTNNGEILLSGGTLSGRQNKSSHERQDEFGSQDFEKEEQREERLNSSPKWYLSNQRDPLHKTGYRPNQAFQHRHFQHGSSHFAYQEQMRRFGSEPNLRMSATQHISEEMEMKEKKGRKKYKAPPPPKSNRQNNKYSQKDWEENSSAENGSAFRKARLFKTKAETKKNYSSPVQNPRSLDYLRHEDLKDPCPRVLQEINIDPGVNVRQRERNIDLRANRLSLPEIKLNSSKNNFQEELREATKRLRKLHNVNEVTRHSSREDLEVKRNKEKLKTLDHNITKENIKNKLKQMANSNENHDFDKIIDCIRSEGSGKESSPDPSQQKTVKNLHNQDQPKMFYFGMDAQKENNCCNDLLEHFASNMHSNTALKIPNSSESDLSSELEMDEGTSKSGIDLQLRPILPKKQLEIPRFSPAAAWKMLSAIDHLDSTITTEDLPVFLEDRIEKYARPPPLSIQLGQRSSNCKSGDSGISGDAGPTGYEDTTEPILNTRTKLEMRSFRQTSGMSWTPQQDLGDDSSLEEGVQFGDNYHSKPYGNQRHVFSLSLPRDNQLASYITENSNIKGIQKIKRSVLNNINKKETQPNLSQDQSENWFLSKSAPNSINNGFNSLEIKRSQKSDESEQIFNSHIKSLGRVMYLPEAENNHGRQGRSKAIGERRKDKSRSVERSNAYKKITLFSRSCENLSEIKSNSEPEDLQDPPKPNDSWKFTRKPKRFTFQSTVRQIERRRLAEKLSKEAEKKEKQRLRELEAMQRVEEEFQKKRAREKATIRQQLRLFSMEDNGWSSLPPDLEIKNTARPDPDGAVSSSTTSSPTLPTQNNQEQVRKYYKSKKLSDSSKYRPTSESSEDNIRAPATQVLSEYRQPQREYKEYRSNNRYQNEKNSKQTTIHPEVTCKMPKAKGPTMGSTTNYRKDFAHGVKNKSGGSTYSDDSQTKHSPRMYDKKQGPITRF